MKPKMILFDYGGTLLWERDYNFPRAYQAMFDLVVDNPMGVTSEEVYEFSEDLFQKANVSREKGYEIHEFQFIRVAADYFGLTFSAPIEEVERVMWKNASTTGKMPHIDELLAYLKQNHIRTGVISNIGWSGGALKERLDSLFPKNEFEFVLASSEYAIRKPNPILFQIALHKATRKAELTPSEVWFCGDTFEADIAGAHAAGMYPVYYDVTENTKTDAQADYEYLHIGDWMELIDTLEKL